MEDEEERENGERLHNGDLQDLYVLPSKIEVDQIEESKIGWLHDLYGGEEKCVHVLVGLPERRRPLGETGLDGKTI
jgi:hypothetical protein